MFRFSTQTQSSPLFSHIVFSYFHYYVCWQHSRVEKSKCLGEGEGQGSAFPLNQDSKAFPGGPMVKNPLANAGDMGSSPWCGKILHAREQLGLCTTSTEASL